MADRDDDDKLGGRFWLALCGLAVGVVCIALIVLIIFGWFWSRWGLLGALIAFFAVLLVIGWLYDRREKARRARLASEFPE
jgi:Flp pilus assembly protein TadB